VPRPHSRLSSSNPHLDSSLRHPSGGVLTLAQRHPERSSSPRKGATIKCTHFPLDSRNENLPEKRIHRNYASRPGGRPRRAFCCAPASRGRARRVSRVCRKTGKYRRSQPCRFKRAKAEIPPAGRAGRATGQRSCWKICWRKTARRLRARRSSWRRRARSRRFACVSTGWCRCERTSQWFSTYRRSRPPPTASLPRQGSWLRSRTAISRRRKPWTSPR
jgi:hypothetical protein